ncbi:2Fe-2S iron-sulfur cluster-binding protein, partial [Cribrihabitans sp. XS_ASV171]
VQADPVTRDLAQRFHAHGAAQCGICTPGMMVTATALLRAEPSPDEQLVKDTLGGVLCRCTGYRKIIDAVAGRPAPSTGAPDGHAGASPVRLDGQAKVTGAEAFGDDVA